MPRKKVVTPLTAPEPPAPIAAAPMPQRPPRQRAPRPEPPNPTVIAFQEQLVPLVAEKEMLQRRVREVEDQLSTTQQHLDKFRRALGDVDASIQYRMQIIAQLTGKP